MKKILLFAAALGTAVAANAQSAMDGYEISRSDLKGTARYMSMAGAFGALGGDLSTLTQNPAGIGVYRKSELGFTIDVDIQNNTSDTYGAKFTTNPTNFIFSNIGGVAAWNLHNDVMPFLNFGFTYQKSASFNRSYSGNVGNLANSMSNWIAGVSNNNALTAGDVITTSSYDPYNPTDGGYVSPWISILGYDSYLVSPTGDPNQPYWEGLYQKETRGSGYFKSQTAGGIDEYNISFGGNIANTVFWGMDFGITSLSFTQETLWGESLDNAMLPAKINEVNDMTTSFVNGSADWDLYNIYSINGTGFNYKLGVIVKPIQELRIGFAFHTPTWYNLTESYYGDTSYSMTGSPIIRGDGAKTNNGNTAYNDYNFHTPWRFIASVAGVLGNNLIVSADYEWAGYGGMKFSERNNLYWNGWDYVSSGLTDSYADTNTDIKNYYKSTNTFRLGAEYRVTPNVSVRAGYCHVSSPVKDGVKNGQEAVYTVGTRPQYTWDNSTNYITCGLGYRYQAFYADLAYVWKNMTSDFHAYEFPNAPMSKLSFTDNQIVLSMGFKF